MTAGKVPGPELPRSGAAVRTAVLRTAVLGPADLLRSADLPRAVARAVGGR